jgi:RNA polymerase sigma factor (sigma-70 family)
MSTSRFETEPTSVDLSSFSISQLLDLSTEDRSSFILQNGRADLAAALQTLRDGAAPIANSVTIERVAWALSLNVEGVPVDDSRATKSARSGIRGYKDRWPPDTKWETIWSIFIKPLARDGSETTTLLAELSLSVACEQRDDWQNCAARPLHLPDANRLFQFIYEQHRLKVAGDVFRRFGNRAGDSNAIADEAWARVFCDYWSVKARRRFLGLSRISTLVCQVAHHIAYDALRQFEKSSAASETAHVGSTVSLEELSMVSDIASRVNADQLRLRIKDCIAYLPSRQQIVATMVWVRAMQANRVAQILNVSEAAVSQHLSKAREALRKCLRQHGFVVPGEAGE